jgi:glycosyltransferase involved in cell wall biosynthesis
MKILYDHQMFSLQKYGGITRYFCELIKNLPVEYTYELSLLFSNNQHLKDDYKFFRKLNMPIPKQESRIRGHLRAKSYSINNSYSRRVISSNNFDLLHPTYFNPYFLNLTKKPYVVTVHDLIVFKFENVDRKKEQMEAMERIVHNARRIIAISEHTKKDLIEILKVNPEKIDVVYHGFNQFAIENTKNEFGRYILYVGARPGYKNFSNFIKAFRDISVKDSDLKLICTGAPFSKNEVEELRNLNILEKCISIGVDEKKLNELYSHALTFVYPTVYEGFGMSILEAFANDCPVCLSNASCLPEIAGKAGIYFDPENPDSIQSAITKTIYDKSFSSQMIAEGKKRLQNFSWEKCARQTVESYKRALA